MRTSYFARYKCELGVSIALVTPKWFIGNTYPDLFPTWLLVNAYKRSNRGAVAQDEYTEAYHLQVLDHLDPVKVYTDLKDSVLLCYEVSHAFCHRHIVAQWLEDQLDIIVTEVE